MNKKNIINPFANKGRIISGVNFIGRFEGLKTVANTVTELPMPNNLAIIGYPRIGKSSLAKHAIIPKKESLAQQDKIPVWIDFSGFSNRDAFFKNLVKYSFETLKKCQKDNQSIKEAASEILDHAKPWDDMKYDIETYFETVRSSGLYTIFVLDEFDEARNKFANNTEAFRMLRNLGYDADQFGVAFVTTSRRSIRDIETQSKVSSTLDGIFGKEYLGMYTHPEMLEYYHCYENIGLHLDPQQQQRVEYYCGGHPYLLAVLGFEIVETFKETTEIDVDRIFKRVQLEFLDYYEQLVTLLTEDKTYARLLQILFGPRIDVKPTDIEELLTYGLIKKSEKFFTAYSPHFQGYLKFKEQTEKVEIETWTLLKKAEKGLRELILKTLTAKFDENWLETYPQKYNNLPDKQKRLKTILNRLQDAHQRDIEQYGMLASNLTLLDQTYIHQLFEYFILLSWDDLFSPIFQHDKPYWTEVKNLFEKIRNPFAHHKTELLPEWEIKKAETYCREIILIVEKNM